MYVLLKTNIVDWKIWDFSVLCERRIKGAEFLMQPHVREVVHCVKFAPHTMGNVICKGRDNSRMNE